jgi:beta-glucosidase
MITIKNIGDVFGKEVVQLYIEKVDSAFYRPIKELKGFEKVELKPGETKSVSFVFDEYTFRYYNVETKQFEIEGGLYNIFIGSSSSNTPLSGSIILKGTTNILPYQNLNVPSYDTGYVQNVNVEEFQKILGRKVPNSKISFYKKNRLHANKQTLIEDLKYAKGCFGRLIYYSIKFGILCLKLVGKRDKVNMLEMGVLQQPLRGISRLSGGKISWEQLQGIIQMINGHFIKGLHQFIKERRRKHRLNKNKM